jgi:hypothetical protein
MSATKVPSLGLPASAPVVTKEWIPGAGETETQEWPIGTPAEILAKYEESKAAAEGGNNTQRLTYRNAQGRANLVAQFGRSGNSNDGYGPDISIVEELYSLDVIKDTGEAPYFGPTALASGHPLYSKQTGKGAPITPDQFAWVRYCAENHLEEAEITTEAVRLGKSATLQWASWGTLMKELRGHLIHGNESFFETGFILRRSMYGVKTSQIKATFVAINTVVTAPTFKSAMDQLILALPSGEWLYKPPQAEHQGRGRWRITQEWQWAEKWSIMYGGTWTGIP